MATKEPVGIYSEGQIILGGLFPVRDKGLDHTCGTINKQRGIQRLEAMRYAVRDINNNPKILGNITLGVKIFDTCSDATHALDQSLDFVMSTLEVAQPALCPGEMTTEDKQPDLVMAIIGAAYSSVSIQVANLLRLFKIPQISYASTSAELSQKDRYGYFMRTVPPDKLQAKALVDIVYRFNWTYVTTVASEGEYGDSGIAAFKKMFEERAGHCIAAAERISRAATAFDFISLVRRLRIQKAKVVILFVREDDAEGILRAAQTEQYINDFIWIASDGWGNGQKPVAGNEQAAAGSLTITLQSQYMKEFDDYFLSLTPENNKENIWFQEYWEDIFGCRWQDGISVNESLNDSITYLPVTHTEHTFKRRICSENETDVNYRQEAKIQFVYDAVYAVALGLDRVYKEICGPDAQGFCDELRTNDSLRTILRDYIKENDQNGEYLVLLHVSASNTKPCGLVCWSGRS